MELYFNRLWESIKHAFQPNWKHGSFMIEQANWRMYWFLCHPRIKVLRVLLEVNKSRCLWRPITKTFFWFQPSSSHHQHRKVTQACGNDSVCSAKASDFIRASQHNLFPTGGDINKHGCRDMSLRTECVRSGKTSMTVVKRLWCTSFTSKARLDCLAVCNLVDFHRNTVVWASWLCARYFLLMCMIYIDLLHKILCCHSSHGLKPISTAILVLELHVILQQNTHQHVQKTLERLWLASTSHDSQYLIYPKASKHQQAYIQSTQACNSKLKSLYPTYSVHQRSNSFTLLGSNRVYQPKG